MNTVKYNSTKPMLYKIIIYKTKSARQKELRSSSRLSLCLRPVRVRLFHLPVIVCGAMHAIGDSELTIGGSMRLLETIGLLGD